MWKSIVEQVFISISKLKNWSNLLVFYMWRCTALKKRSIVWQWQLSHTYLYGDHGTEIPRLWRQSEQISACAPSSDRNGNLARNVSSSLSGSVDLWMTHNGVCLPQLEIAFQIKLIPLDGNCRGNYRKREIVRDVVFRIHVQFGLSCLASL